MAIVFYFGLMVAGLCLFQRVQMSSSVRLGTTRVKVLRTEEERIRYLNATIGHHSQAMKQELFFGKRPILYITRYNCNTPAGTPSGSNTALDPPDFPPEEPEEEITSDSPNPVPDISFPGPPQRPQSSKHI